MLTRDILLRSTSGRVEAHAFQHGPDWRPWVVYLSVAHLFGGRKFQQLSAPAVVDDFGDLVLVGPLQ